ncbi:MAG: pyruvate kinase [Candidatus Woesearchaeota archaeon]|jgi:pyruvate kinase
MNLRDKRTKIVATISDRRCSKEFLQKLYDNGLDCVRMNTAHQDREGILKVVQNTRAVSDKIPILMDTKGPEVRTLGYEKEVTYPTGAEVAFKGTDDTNVTSDEKTIYVNFPNIAKEVPVGANILVDDGYIQFTVKKITEDSLIAVVDNEGTIKNKKSVNIPNVDLNLIVLTEKDKEFIKLAIDEKIDFIAHSFVQHASDLQQIQKILDEHKSPIKLISKIESQMGVDNLDEILEHCDGVMIARGDLGVEIPAAEVPTIQKMMIKKCIRKNKMVITATQMLESMCNNPRPTRAEVSDVANAVLDGTGCLMLSGETASGDFPEESVATMASIAQTIEEKKPEFKYHAMETKASDSRGVLVKAAISASQELGAKAIIVPSVTGITARMLGTFRPKIPIYAQCTDSGVMRELGLAYNVRASMIEEVKHVEELVCKSLQALVDDKKLELDDTVVILGRTPEHESGSTNFLEVNQVKNCLKNYDKK